MVEKYEADIVAINGEKIGKNPHGKATFSVNGNNLDIKISMDDTPENTQHWEHFHGFPDGKDAQIATAAQDANGDGFVDLPETEPVSGTTMVPFNDQPEEMNIPNDEYPVSDDKGHFDYERVVPLDILEKKFKEAFGDTELNLDKRVIYIHGVPDSLELPVSVGGAVGDYDAHTTLPIAVGKIKRV
ncbi:hypothetical protein [Companilactobacillus sp.]|jgi:hypothetical protein|uniref:hypothetical protein n=1 Tax=Companilactobacillus sp. TaxID=2767905 RepID=UPI0025C3F75A|nr:hypothetical protein [Companilactobacillus sp.]MCH4009104.1 hypothetical protein [Companilactobacillus sp.]MCH4050717.1 hypothetical protein [Companilactobacillus sp.]MCH4077046.1 hypothetical protein [Companilactobacillus sp.]MCH4125622.1 hypothetical protein [Companilactobacillus sp.]MCI1311331.1 hypothetical protein [Companilactobacillus sp.]